MTHADSELHVVLGAGQVGPVLAQKLVARGKRVRIISRSTAPEVAGADWARGDLTERAFLSEAVRGATAVYHCANPMRYDRWEELLPPIARSVQSAVAHAGARLVVLDNLYMYGAPERPIDETTPERPKSGKGRLRARLAAELQAAQARGELHVSVGRASDFFGPRAERAVTFGSAFFRNLARGRASYALGNPDLAHSYAYIPDVAEGLLQLGLKPTRTGETWILPHAWHGTSRALAARFGELARREARLWTVPDWLVRFGGMFDAELSAVPEMLYQWKVPFTVDDSRFRAAFGVEPTPVERALRETLASYGLEATAGARVAVEAA